VDIAKNIPPRQARFAIAGVPQQSSDQYLRFTWRESMAYKEARLGASFRMRQG